jgi:DNA repair exonuclease SbcCD ATPase subunit
MSTDQANQVLADLETKLSEAIQRLGDLQTKRRELSFAANTGDAKARKALEAANASTATIGHEIENIRSAIEEATRRLREAENVEATAHQKNVAAQAQALGASMVERARKIDEALATVASEASGFMADISALNRLGTSNPRAEQWKSLGERALATALLQTPLQVRPLGHGEKRNFSETALGWATSIDDWASALLDKSEAA